MWAVLVLLGTVGSVLGAEDTFTSFNSMEALVHTERRVIEVLKTLIANETKRLPKLKRYLSYYEVSHQKAALDPAAYVRNPLNSFHLMNRLTTDWQQIEDIIKKPKKMSRLRKKLDLPVKGDLSGAVEALCRLQYTYKLNISDLVRGAIRGVKYSQPMSAHDAWTVGNEMYHLYDFFHANMWFKAALELNEAEVGTNPLKPTHLAAIIEFAAYCAYKLGNFRRALNLTETFLALMPHDTRNQENRDYFKSLLAGQDKETPDDIDLQGPRYRDEKDEEIQESYAKLCRGEVEVNHALVCRYTDNGKPYFLLGRVKMEEVNLDPRIVVFHDVIYDSEIENIKKIARPIIRRSMVTELKKQHGNNTSRVDKLRVSKTAFLDRHHEVVATVDRRASLLANLCEVTSESLQVLNYGIGGHYEPHFDHSDCVAPSCGFPPNYGNRIATLLYYMSDVEQGGATVFPRLGAAVFPRKGSALLWYNLHRDGEGDHRTLHGACPVLIGDKWVSNKWFHEGMQEFIRPCLLEQDSLRYEEKN